MKVLLIDSAAKGPLAELLRMGGLAVEHTQDREDVENLLRDYQYDAAVLVEYAEDPPAAKLVGALRRGKISTPILVLSQARALCRRIDTYSQGADVLLEMPVNPAELIAVILALGRRAAGYASSTVVCANMVVNLDSKTVEVDGIYAHLTNREYTLLEILLLRKGRGQNKEELMSQIYGGRDEPEPKIIDVFICKLRKKLRDAGATCAIETVWGRGYMLSDAPTIRAKINVPPQRDSMASTILSALSKQEGMTFRQIINLLPTASTGGLRSAIGSLIGCGWAKNDNPGTGPQQIARYSLTIRGAVEAARAQEKIV